MSVILYTHIQIFCPYTTSYQPHFTDMSKIFQIGLVAALIAGVAGHTAVEKFEAGGKSYAGFRQSSKKDPGNQSPAWCECICTNGCQTHTDLEFRDESGLGMAACSRRQAVSPVSTI